MSNQVKYKTYKSLSEALRRDEIRSCGVTSTTFLDCFLSNDGELRASYVEAKGLCKIGTFKIWRKEMIAKGWLVYKFGQYSRHYPGPKLIKYINKEKMLTSEIATTEELAKIREKILTSEIATTEELTKVREEMATKKELDEVKSEVDQLKLVVQNMIEEFDPPVTEEKIQRRLKIVKAK